MLHLLVVAGREEREERVMVLELMVVLFGGGDGFWRRIQKEVEGSDDDGDVGG